MKKILLSSVLVAHTLLATDDAYEIKPMIGYVDTKDNVDIKNHKVIGIGVSKNVSEKYIVDKLELSLLQSKNINYKNNLEDTKVTLLSFNGIKDYQIKDNFKLYALVGVGFEYISNSKYGNESDPFFNYGVGAAYSLPNDMLFSIDARHELKFNNDKNVIYTLGLSIPFGEKSSSKIQNVEDDLTEKVAVTFQNSDRDDVNIAANLGVLFEIDSAEIKDSDMSKFQNYVSYVQTIPNAKIILEGHADSTGTDIYNLELSKKRANSAKKVLLSMGINENQISTIGYGEKEPLVSNDTVENRTLNRRVVGHLN